MYKVSIKLLVDYVGAAGYPKEIEDSRKNAEITMNCRSKTAARM